MSKFGTVPLAAIYYLTSVSLLSQIKKDFTEYTDIEAGMMKGSSSHCSGSSSTFCLLLCFMNTAHSLSELCLPNTAVDKSIPRGKFHSRLKP